MLLPRCGKEVVIAPLQNQFYETIEAILTGNISHRVFTSWQTLLPYLNNHGLQNRVYRLIREQQLACSDPDTLDQLKRGFQNQLIHSQHWLNSLVCSDQLLSSENIDFLVIKGYSLAERFYKNPFDRRSTDLDLVLPIRTRSQVERIFQRNGFKKLDEKKILENHHKSTFVGPGKGFLPIELHFGLGQLPINESTLFSNSNHQSYRDVKISVLSLSDELNYLLYHAGVQHRFSSLVWMMDFIEIFKSGDFQISENQILPVNQKSYNFVEYICNKLIYGDEEFSSREKQLIWEWVLSDSDRLKKLKILLLRGYFTSPKQVMSYWLRKTL